MTDHETFLAIIGNWDVPETVPNVVLGEMGSWPYARPCVPHARQRERGRRHHSIRTDRVIVAQSPLATSLVDDGPRGDRRRLKHLCQAMSGHVLHRTSQQPAVCFGDALKQALLTFPSIKRDLGGGHLLPRVDSHATLGHHLVQLAREPDVPPLSLPRYRYIRPRRLRRGGLDPRPWAIKGVHVCLGQGIIDGT